MKMFKELASLKDAKVKSVIVSENPDLSITLCLRITKGCMTAEWKGWGQIFEHAVGENFVGIDDYDDECIQSMSIGGLPIDDVPNFISTLQNSGMQSVAKMMDISFEVRREAFHKAVGSSEAFKKLFPGKIVFETLPLKEKQDVVIDYCIKEDNYKYYLLSRLEIVEKSNMTPTKEQLLQFKKDRVTIKSIEEA